MRRWTMLALLALFIPAPAQALEWWASEDGDYALEGRGLLKQQSVVYDLYDDPLLWSEKWAGESLSRARLGLTFLLLDVEFATEFETRLTTRTSGLDRASGLGAFDTSTAGRPRVWDVPDLSSGGLTWQNDIDRLYVRAPLGPMDLTIGRQAVSWGSAWFWKVTDRFSPFSPMDFDPEFKRGVDGIRTEWFLGATTSLDIIATFERNPYRWNLGARYRTTVGRYDLAVSAARLGNDYMGGAEFSGELWDFGVRGEGAFTWNTARSDWDIQAVLGIDYGFDWKMKVALEAFYNGYGTDNPDEYASYWFDPSGGVPAKSERLTRAETFNIGRYYLGLSIDQELHPLVHLVVSGMLNAMDPSAFVTLGLQWSVQQNVRFIAGSMIAIGERPNLTAGKLPSDFGFYPNNGYAVLKVSF